MAVLGVVFGSMVFLFRYRLAEWAGIPQVVDLEKVVAEVENYTPLPKEEPFFAIVTDKNTLSAQSFFSNAENGDYVLLFKEAEQAILFRPSTKKIVRASKISLNPEEELQIIGDHERKADEERILGASIRVTATQTKTTTK